MATKAAHGYNDPINGTDSDIGKQLATFYYQKQALIEKRKDQVFMQLSDTTNLPKHFGKTIKRFHYIPLLDDANINSQGIDASGASITKGNLYGSSKDIGTISGKLPTLTEYGGRVNRVGFKRKEIEGSIEKFGYFQEYTQESMDFDSDADLAMHINREMLNGAYEMTEAALQIDILNSAGVVKFAGTATSAATIKENAIISYGDIMRLNIDLDNNRTPKNTTMITGTRNIDTRVIPSARVAYCGSELLPTMKAMKDLHNNPAFISVEHYAAGATVLNHEAGSIDQTRIVIVPEMLKWEGGGAITANTTIYTTGGKADVFPFLIVGEKSFQTIGFQTNGKTVKFVIYHKKPGEATADRNDPYGEQGFMSIKWYYGFMALRPERIGLIKTAAKL